MPQDRGDRDGDSASHGDNSFEDDFRSDSFPTHTDDIARVSRVRERSN